MRWKPLQPFCPACRTRHWPAHSCSWKADMAFADSGLRPKCPKCSTNHWPKDPCDISSKYDPLCQLCHHWHPPSIFCNPFDVPPKPDEGLSQEKKDQAAVDWQAEGEQLEWEAKHRHKGKQ